MCRDPKHAWLMAVNVLNKGGEISSQAKLFTTKEIKDDGFPTSFSKLVTLPKDDKDLFVVIAGTELCLGCGGTGMEIHWTHKVQNFRNKVAERNMAKDMSEGQILGDLVQDLLAKSYAAGMMSAAILGRR